MRSSIVAVRVNDPTLLHHAALRACVFKARCILLRSLYGGFDVLHQLFVAPLDPNPQYCGEERSQPEQQREGEYLCGTEAQ